MLGDRAAGLEGVVGVVFAMAAIALGTLVGVSFSKWFGERARRLATRLAR
jgi:L-serine deaminase